MISRLPLLIVVMICICSGYALGEAKHLLADGFYWSKVDDVAKLDVVRAAVDSYDTGWADGVSAEDGRLYNQAHFVDPADRKSVARTILQETAEGHLASLSDEPKFSRPVGFYAQAIDDFYTGRSKKASRMTIGFIIGCLSDHPTYTCDEVEKLAPSQ